MFYERFQKKVGQNIKKARLTAEMTQEGMARFGFNIRHFQDIEAGKVRMTLQTLYRIAQAFEISPESLLKSK